jgi:hypothetical protein
MARLAHFNNGTIISGPIKSPKTEIQVDLGDNVDIQFTLEYNIHYLRIDLSPRLDMKFFPISSTQKRSSHRQQQFPSDTIRSIYCFLQVHLVSIKASITSNQL